MKRILSVFLVALFVLLTFKSSVTFASDLPSTVIKNTIEEEYITPPSSDLKIRPIYTPALSASSMPAIDYFYYALPENGIFAHRGNGNPLNLSGIGGGTVQNHWDTPGVYTVNVSLNDSSNENSELIKTVLPVIIEAPNSEFKIKPIYTPALIRSSIPTIDYFYDALPENGIFAHKNNGAPLYLGGIGGGTAENNWNKPGVYTVNVFLNDPSDENSELIETVLPVVIEAP